MGSDQPKYVAAGIPKYEILVYIFNLSIWHRSTQVYGSDQPKHMADGILKYEILVYISQAATNLSM